MHTSRTILLFLITLLLAHACDESRLNLDIAIVPREVTNFTEVNSAFDDYNSAGPLYFAQDAFTLVFSSNRNSSGDNFDLVTYQCFINYDQVNISFDIWTDPWDYPVIDSMNSSNNEWGPYLTLNFLGNHFLHHDLQEQEVPDTSRLFFSSDRGGDQDIYYCYYSLGGELFPGEIPVGINLLNTEFEEGYLCLHQDATMNQDPSANMDSSAKQETGYFTSDREGTFDIYMAVAESDRRIETSASLEVSKVDILSSDSNDKCPYIVYNMMVFTSDREGGQGGFDLWYSVYTDGTWSSPENFGPGINTAYDEYRPVIIPLQPDLFVNDMLLFSSNRPGGKGGFDLYYTGMDKRGATAFNRFNTRD